MHNLHSCIGITAAPGAMLRPRLKPLTADAERHVLTVGPHGVRDLTGVFPRVLLGNLVYVEATVCAHRPGAAQSYLQEDRNLTSGWAISLASITHLLFRMGKYLWPDLPYVVNTGVTPAVSAEPGNLHQLLMTLEGVQRRVGSLTGRIREMGQGVGFGAVMMKSNIPAAPQLSACHGGGRGAT